MKYLGSLIVSMVFIATLANAQYSCGGNCPSYDCDSEAVCYCGYTSNYVDVTSLCNQGASDVGWSVTCCQCIANAESSGNANAINDDDGETSVDVGVFQINTVNWACNGGNPPCDPNSNLACAEQVYQNAGGSWSPWSTASGCGC